MFPCTRLAFLLLAYVKTDILKSTRTALSRPLCVTTSIWVVFYHNSRQQLVEERGIVLQLESLETKSRNIPRSVCRKWFWKPFAYLDCISCWIAPSTIESNRPQSPLLLLRLASLLNSMEARTIPVNPLSLNQVARVRSECTSLQFKRSWKASPREPKPKGLA